MSIHLSDFEHAGEKLEELQRALTLQQYQSGDIDVSEDTRSYNSAHIEKLTDELNHWAKGWKATHPDNAIDSRCVDISGQLDEAEQHLESKLKVVDRFKVVMGVPLVLPVQNYPMTFKWRHKPVGS